jgi:hypothetical protein
MFFYPLSFILQSGKNTSSIPFLDFYYNIMDKKIKMISLYFSINGKRKKGANQFFNSPCSTNQINPTRRKPRATSRMALRIPLRQAARQYQATSAQRAPRMTRLEPFDGPKGFFAGLFL